MVQSREDFDLVVIGAGPGGYVGAIKAAQLGAKVALIEASHVGGTCLNVGCIPTKALIAGASLLHKIKSAEAFGISVDNVRFDYSRMKTRKDDVVAKIRKNLAMLIQSNRVELIPGFGKLVDAHQVRVELDSGYRLLHASHIILATGSRPNVFPPFKIDGKKVHDSSTILEITQLPKKIIVVGGGYIGCEFACMFHELGVEVIVVEALDRLVTQECFESSQFLENSFRRRGIKILTKSLVVEQLVEDVVKLKLASGEVLEADMVLVAVGRSFNTQAMGLETAGVYVNPKGAVEVNNQLQTNLPHIYAIGDITAKWMLAHTASHQAIVAASNACGHYTTMDYSAVPAVIFTSPEIASVGYTFEKAKEAGFNAIKGQFPFQALGKAQAALEAEGFAQVIIDKPSGRILGAQVVGHEAGALIAEMALAIQNELTLECLVHTIHAHPTISEAWLEAALIAADTPLHMPPKKVKAAEDKS